MLRIFIITCVFITSALLSSAQDDFTVSVNRHSLKKANKLVNAGDVHFYYNNYYKALQEYKEAYTINPNDANLNYKIGKCYLYSESGYKSLKYFTKAYQLKRDVAKDIHLMLGRGFHLNAQFTQAMNEYKAYLLTLKKEEKEKKKIKVEKLISECITGKSLINNQTLNEVINLGIIVNSKYNDHSPIITNNGTVLIFTSTRENGRKIGEDGQYDENIYHTVKYNTGWSKPEALPHPVNTQFNDATVGISPDGTQLLIYNGNHGNGDIQICNLKNGKWSSPKNLPGQINSEYKETSACFSFDGKKIFFTSDRPGGFGGTDIYVCTKMKNGKWSKALNLGENVNSKFDEETVSMSSDGKSLYFSSSGHNTSGGFDIFTTTISDDNSWSTPKNMGYPINSPGNDFCFVMTKDGKTAYLSSERCDSNGGLDIYKVIFCH